MRLILGVALMALGVFCLFLSNHQYWELQLEVNDRLPSEQKSEPMFWTLATRLKFRQLQKRVLPDSLRPKQDRRLAFAGLGLLFSGLAILASLR